LATYGLDENGLQREKRAEQFFLPFLRLEKIAFDRFEKITCYLYRGGVGAFRVGLNPLSPDMTMEILLTVLHTFLMELVRRI